MARASRPPNRSCHRLHLLALPGQRGGFVGEQIRRCRRLRPRHGNRRSRHGERIAKTRKSENAKKAQGQRSPSWSRNTKRLHPPSRFRAFAILSWHARRDPPTVHATVSICSPCRAKGVDSLGNRSAVVAACALGTGTVARATVNGSRKRERAKTRKRRKDNGPRHGLETPSDFIRLRDFALSRFSHGTRDNYTSVHSSCPICPVKSNAEMATPRPPSRARPPHLNRPEELGRTRRIDRSTDGCGAGVSPAAFSGILVGRVAVPPWWGRHRGRVAHGAAGLSLLEKVRSRR